MAIHSIYSYSSTTATSSSQSKSVSKSSNNSATNATSNNASSSTISDTAAVYEQSSSSSTAADYATQNSALITQLKADTDNRVAQLQGIVQQIISKQGSTLGSTDSIWSFLAKGNFTVDAETKAQAQADIAEDGYWGVDQTSDRIVDFAKALSGGDTSKSEELLDAFKKGFSEATKSWGKSLPSISQDTYDSVIKKFDQWVNGKDN